MPAEKRYELLKDWTLPTEKRQAVRLLADFTAIDRTPEAFAHLALWNRKNSEQPEAASTKAEATRDGSPPAAISNDKASEPASQRYVVSTVDWLIDAARETNHLEELMAAAADAAAKKLNQAQALSWLVSLARGPSATVAPDFKQYVADYPQRLTNPNDRPPLAWESYLAARAALRHDAWRASAEQLLLEMKRHAQQVYGQNWLTRIHHDQGVGIALRRPSDAVPGRDTGLALWHSTSVNVTAPAQPYWIAQDEIVAHIAGPGDDFLLFDYPLTGEFEFSVDAVLRGWGEANVSYAGLVFEPLHGGSITELWPIGRNETRYRPDPVERSGDVFNRLTLVVRPDRVRCLCNGHLACEDTSPSPTSPWLALFSEATRDARWCNVSIKGDVRIPREVPLSFGDRLDGWVAMDFSTRPPRLTLGQKQPERYGGQEIPKQVEPDDYSWSSRDGVITSQSAAKSGLTQSRERRLFYFRPLRPGDSLRYEFYYEPGVSEVHPAFDRLVFLLRPDGVQTHWMNEVHAGSVNAWNGLTDDNVIDEPSFRSGPPQLPFKAGDWNSLRVSLVEDVAVVQLNGVEIFRRPLEVSNTRQFGLYHRAGENVVQVRNVVLSGNWPEMLSAEQLANCMARTPEQPTTATLRAQHAIIEEKFFTANWNGILQRGRALPPAERYAFLRHWVLPDINHPHFRFMGGFTSTDPAPVGSIKGAAAADGTKRVVTGSGLMAPVLDLLEVARDLNKLDDLANLAFSVQPETEFDERSKFAFLALVSLFQKKVDAAAGYMEQVRPLLEKMPGGNLEFQRWPELVLASQALDTPALRPQAQALLEKMVEQIQKQYLTSEWEMRVRPLRDRARYLVLADAAKAPLGVDSPSKQWSRVTHGTAQSRGLGYFAPQWHLAKGEARHFAGHDRDYLYFNTPLRGNFEVKCQLTTFGWRETGLGYAAIANELRYTLDKYELMFFGRGGVTNAINPPVPRPGDFYDYRLVVQDGSYISYMQGQKVHEQRLPLHPDPWLVISSIGARTGGARNLRITGNPEIPTSIELSENADLDQWIPSYFSETMGNENANWFKRGEEIIGRKNAELAAAIAGDPKARSLPGTHRQSLLKYHRPLLEDGELEYEFYYEPEATMVHPALDRLTFLIEPAGVKLHWLTDAQFDSTGVSPDNTADEPTNRRGPKTLPLKERDWNRLKLGVKGDDVTLTLNGVEIYQRPLEASNQRIFGLFHWLDDTEVRVRNVAYRGDWPRRLPPVDEQELAASP
jgi:hypothetical protein